ncbi:MAG: glycosyltransferase, partial [Kaistella sp.]
LVPKILEQFPQFDHMIYCSEKIMRLMHQNYPNLQYPPESVIINAIPVEEIRKKSGEKIPEFANRPVFVSVGRLHTRKGYHKLMEAHHRLLKDGFEHSVMIIGDGEELPNLLAQQKKLDVERTFIFAGNKMNPYPYIKNADFFIMPSESEAWPLVLAEALVLQKPTIATDTGDVASMMEDRKTGYLISYNTEEMYLATKEFLTNPELVENLRTNLKTIEKNFDNRKIFMAIEEIILNLVKK